MALRDSQQHRRAELLALRRTQKQGKQVSIASLYETAMRAYLRKAKA